MGTLASSTAPQSPPAELLRALAVLVEPVTPAHAAVAEALALPAPPDGSAWADLFLFQLHPYASVHMGPEGMMGGEARGRVAGFWRAVGRTPPTEPDHLTALLGLYAALLDEAADLSHAGEQAAAALVEKSAAALVQEHLLPWVVPFLDRVEELGDEHQRGWGRLLRPLLVAAQGPQDPDTLPLHLRLAPSLEDPREAENPDFVSQLLAPVRSGLILTRQDLARLGRGLGLGLRAGERRYALEHLLGLDPSGVLEALAELTQSRMEEYRGWSPTLGGIRGFWLSRAEWTAALLSELALDTDEGEP